VSPQTIDCDDRGGITEKRKVKCYNLASLSSRDSKTEIMQTSVHYQEC